MNAVIGQNLPDARGHFGPYGGRYVPETLMHPLQELRVFPGALVFLFEFLQRVDQRLRHITPAIRTEDVDAPVAGTRRGIPARPERPGVPKRIRVLPEGILRPA